MKLGLGLGLAAGCAPSVFDPVTAGISGLTEDLWASSGTTVVSGNVSAWAERSGATGSSSATQGTAGNRPAYNATGIGGRPSIDFSAGKYLSLAMSKSVGNFTAFFVYSPDGAAGTLQVMLDYQSGRLLFAHLGSAAGTTGWYDGAFRTAAAATGAQVLAFRLNSTGGNSASLRRNGTDILTGQAYTQQAIGGVSQTIGTDYLFGSQFLGKIGRIVIYSGNLSTADVQRVERGLGAYYGITVA